MLYSYEIHVLPAWTSSEIFFCCATDKEKQNSDQQQVPMLLIGNANKMLYYDLGRDNRFYFRQEAHPPIERIPELFSGAKTVGR